MRKQKRNRIQSVVSGKSLTRQSEHDRSEINRIVSRGIILPDPNQMTFGDFSGGEDFREIQNRIIAVQQSFSELPSGTREMFGNDPAEMLDFIADPENAEEASNLGLIKRQTREVGSDLVPLKKGVDSKPERSKEQSDDVSDSDEPVT
ncbi:internal scaffolding protein [Microviridae sp.]|nr:internal scaffolding protein [Microviridae sp.]